ncbi:MAG: GNAT family N-acetyltransferase [Anaerolineae bacterium]
MAYSLRAARYADYEALCALLEEVDEIHRDQLPEFFRRLPGPARSASYMHSLISDSKVGFFVAVEEEALVGCVVIAARQTPNVPVLMPRDYAVIECVVVKEAFRGRGVGRALMSMGERWARERGLEAVELDVFEFNTAARAFYEELGYKTVSRRLVKRLHPDA